MAFYGAANDTSSSRHSVTSQSLYSQNRTFSLNKPKPVETLLRAFKTNNLSLNSPYYRLDKAEYNKVVNAVNYYKSTFTQADHVTWSYETGQTSDSNKPLHIAEKLQLVCHIKTINHVVLGKVVVENPEDKFIIPISSSRNLNNLLNNMDKLSNSIIRNKYQVPINHVKLADVEVNPINRFHFYGVVTAINKLPSRTKTSWHSLIFISDPSMVPDSSADDIPPAEFKMHLFLPHLEDHPEMHLGDVVRFTNVKVEQHQSRCDGRVFNKQDITVYCGYADNNQNQSRLESIEDRATTILILAKWWQMNHRFFDYVTPHPVYNSDYKFTGVRQFKEFTNQLHCDVYCKVMGMSDESSDLNFLCVSDGTIFSLLNEKGVARKSDKPLYGYLGLLVFSGDHWRKLKQSNVHVNDYLLLREIQVIFLADETFEKLSDVYPKRYPCVFLSPSDTIKKLPANHHEAAKIRSRLHRLPDALDDMKNWQRPVALPEHDDRLVARLNDPSVQQNLLKRLRRV